MAQQEDQMTNIQGVSGLDPAPQPQVFLRAHGSKRGVTCSIQVQPIVIVKNVFASYDYVETNSL